MAKLYSDSDCDPSVIRSRKVAVIGFGSQGHAHALNLRDSGVEVVVGLHPESESAGRAAEHAMSVMSTKEAMLWADVIMMAVPDGKMAKIFDSDVGPNLRPGKALAFCHGFNIHYKLIQPLSDVDVVLVAPKGQGHGVRKKYEEGGGVPALIAVHQDFTGKAHAIALSYAWGLGCGRAVIVDSSFRDETEADLFAEQAVLCGGTMALVKAGFETLVEAGYSPEAAFFECLHELKLIVDLLHDGGVANMLEKISDTAEWGAYAGGDRVIGEPSRRAMKALLARIQDGSFASEWIEESAGGSRRLRERRAEEMKHELQKIGDELRSRMK